MRPIVLATDYGVTGSYVGQVKAAIHRVASDIKIIDLVHDLPTFNPKASAYLLASYLDSIPRDSIIVAVVDPGVGTEREPIMIQAGELTLIGPNNGLLSQAAQKNTGFELCEIILEKSPSSKTFHGRDIFAPTAAKLAANSNFKLAPMPTEKLVGLVWSDALFEIIYIDHYGNAVTGITSEQITTNHVITINDNKIVYAETFGSVKPGQCFWYYNSNKLVEIAVREASAAEVIQLTIGTKIDFS